MPSTSDQMAPPVVADRMTGEGIELDLRIAADHPALDGHFPGLPIVPGVCLLDWVIRFSAGRLGLLTDGVPQFRIKFRHVLQPGRDVTLSLRSLSGGRVQFEYADRDHVYASGTASPGNP